MVYWTTIDVDGVTYDLVHLRPFAFEIRPQRWSQMATVQVSFNDHCFTEKYDPARHPAPTAVGSRHESRAFSIERWRWSFELPQIVRTLDRRRIARTRHGNLVHLRLPDGEEYAVFFTLRRLETARCALFVVSAYVPSSNVTRPAKTGEMVFNTAVALTLEGKPLKFP